MAARIAVFCSGYGSNFQAILDAVKTKKLKADIALLVCDDPKAHAIRRAAKYGIPAVVLSPKLFHSREDYEKFILSILKNQKANVLVLAGFMRILSPHFIRTYQNRILNIHPSLLPAFKGAHAIRDAYEARAKETGVTVHLVTAEVDAGPILVQKKLKISPKDTLQTLEKRIHKLEHSMYPRAIQEFLSRRLK